MAPAQTTTTHGVPAHPLKNTNAAPTQGSKDLLPAKARQALEEKLSSADVMRLEEEYGAHK
jgi:hypothetical protein